METNSFKENHFQGKEEDQFIAKIRGKYSDIWNGAEKL